MIDTIEELLQDYASYSFIEGTIDEDTMNHLVEDAQNYVAKLNELNLLSLHLVSQHSELLMATLTSRVLTIQNEPDGIVRETMINNLLIDINCG